MTAYRFTFLECDATEGGSECGAEVAEPYTVIATARAVAAKAGWTSVQGKDYCAKHSQQRGEER